MKILILNGPNLNMLGKRASKHYGNMTLHNINQELEKAAEEKYVDLHFYQTNHEGQMIEKIQEAADDFSGVIINPGGLTHSSVSLRDALEILTIPVIEVHLSNIYAREEFRHRSLISPVCSGQISGLGPLVYFLALDAVINLTVDGR